MGGREEIDDIPCFVSHDDEQESEGKEGISKERDKIEQLAS